MALEQLIIAHPSGFKDFLDMALNSI